jgi:uncharacterized repeat protein (TIGR03943 family)
MLLAALLGWLLFSGRVLLYVHEQSVWLLAVCAPLLVAMTLASLQLGNRIRPNHISVGLLGLPLVIGLLVPARPLGSDALALRQVQDERSDARSMDTPIWDPQTPLTLDTSLRVWDLKQLGLLNERDLDIAQHLDGHRAHLLGFVHRTQSLPPDRFLVGRFVVRCCAVDAVGISIPVHYDGAAALARDTWVEVEGSIHTEPAFAAITPVVDADYVRVVPQPAQPYLTLP